MNEGTSLKSEEIIKVSVVVPVFNGERTIFALVEEIVAELGAVFREVEVVLVNDGSPDKSMEEMLRCRERYPRLVKCISLSRNFGEHNAVMCGLHYATGDCVAIIDDDRQNAPKDIIDLIRRLEEGFDVVYSYYNGKQHNFFRNLGSRFNDWVATFALGKPRDLYLSSFKVMRSFLVQKIVQYEGPFPYIDGLILQVTRSIGKQACSHSKREFGRSNYSFLKLIGVWLNMYTGFSVIPLKIITLLGWVTSFFSLALALFFAISWYTGGLFLKQEIPPGWASIIVCMTFFAGIQLCVLGMLGEYIGRTYLHGHQLPQFVVREVLLPDVSRTEEIDD
jgi:polyisoprenyl-phosphate glycosyltransferase